MNKYPTASHLKGEPISSAVLNMSICHRHRHRHQYVKGSHRNGK